MATETFFKRIILSDEAAEKLADGIEKQEARYWTEACIAERRKIEQDYEENRKRSEALLRRMSQSRKF
ncbi:MAG: hypothetical protein FWG44_04920 [Oscillospiraceae bacterium]|nr:hypothetical protein [Oscillospiraceae bacterium]